MKKLLFALMATIISNNALAEWIRVDSTSENADIYVDLSTIRSTGNNSRMWSLTNSKTLQEGFKGGGYLSNKLYWEFDCREERWKITNFASFSETMGAGRVIESINNANAAWNPVMPQAINQVLWEIACDEMTTKTKWMRIGAAVNRDDTDNFTDYEYVDPATINRIGNYVNVWHLIDFRSARNDTQSKNLSIKIQREYDCKEARMRSLSVKLFKANMGIGKDLFSKNDSSEWEPIVPRSIDETAWSMVCGATE